MLDKICSALCDIFNISFAERKNIFDAFTFVKIMPYLMLRNYSITRLLSISDVQRAFSVKLSCDYGGSRTHAK